MASISGGGCRGGSRNSGRGGGGSKITFMKGLGTVGGGPPAVAGSEAQPLPFFFSFPFIWHEN